MDMPRVAIAQYAGATVLDVPPLAAGLLASTIRRAARGEALAGIAGVVSRGAATIATGPPRPRLTAFDSIGSPYLDGTFDGLRARDEIAAFLRPDSRGARSIHPRDPRRGSIDSLR